MRNFTFFFTLLAFTANAQFAYQTDDYYTPPTWEAVLDGNIITITDTGNPEPNHSGIQSRKSFYILYGKNGTVIKTGLQPDGPQTRVITLGKNVVPNFASGFSVRRQKIHYYTSHQSLPIGFVQIPGIVEDVCTSCPDVVTTDTLLNNPSPSWSAQLTGTTLTINDTGAPITIPAGMNGVKWSYKIYGSNGYVLRSSWKAQGPQNRTITLSPEDAANFSNGFAVERVMYFMKHNSVFYSTDSPQQYISNTTNTVTPADPCPPADTVYICSIPDTVYINSSNADTVIINVPASAYEVNWYNVQFGNLVPTSNNPGNVTIETSVLMTTNGVPVSAPVYASGAYIYFLVLKWQGMYFVQNIPYYVP